jgi:serine/threonine protein kinase
MVDWKAIDVRDLTLKVTDFGLSRIMEQSNSTTMTMRGTPGFMAPEMTEAFINGVPMTSYNKNVDAWSLAVVAFALSGRNWKGTENFACTFLECV